MSLSSTFWLLLYIIIVSWSRETLSGATEDNEDVDDPDSRWHMTKIDTDKYPNALCLDGSPGAFWFAPGSGTGIIYKIVIDVSLNILSKELNAWHKYEGASKFIFHHQGGGWCISHPECIARAHFVGGRRKFAELGSSRKVSFFPVHLFRLSRTKHWI